MSDSAVEVDSDECDVFWDANKECLMPFTAAVDGDRTLDDDSTSLG